MLAPSMPGSYESATPSGAVSANAAPRTISSMSDGGPSPFPFPTARTDATAMPTSPASPPDTDQPAAASAASEAPAATGSSKAARIVLGETAVAPISDGRWPSDRSSVIDPLPSVSPPAASTAVPLTTTVPVALAGAPPGENVSAWMRPPPPTTRPVIVCVFDSPSISSCP